jgi:2-methylisocitrate lyase-like PEP mutase family enzyme
MAQRKEIHLVINARVDAYLIPSLSRKKKRNEAILRGNEYKKAGADCIFLPDMEEFNLETIRILVEEIDSPINVIIGSNIKSVKDLENLGVARASMGPRVMRIGLAYITKIMHEILLTGECSGLRKNSISYEEVQSLLYQTK